MNVEHAMVGSIVVLVLCFAAGTATMIYATLSGGDIEPKAVCVKYRDESSVYYSPATKTMMPTTTRKCVEWHEVTYE